MSYGENPDVRTAMRRARALILTPSAEWDRIAAGPATIRSLYIPYVLVLAAIGPVCSAIGEAVFGFPFLGRVVRIGLFALLSSAVVSYAMALVGVFVLGLIIEVLSPYFGGVRDRVQAFKLAAYFPTAIWLAGIFALFPPASFLSILGLYSLYLLYRGLPRVMRVSDDRAAMFTLVTTIVAVIVYLLIATIDSMAAMPR